MAITVDATASNVDDNDNDVDLSHTVHADASILVCGFQASDPVTGTRTPSSVVLDPAGSPEGFTEIAGCIKDDDANDYQVGMWYLVNPVKSGASIIRVTMGGACDGLAAGSISLFGVDTDSPVDATQTAGANSTNPTLSITTTVSGCFVIDSLYSEQNNTPGITQAHTLIFKADVNSGANSAAMQYFDAGVAGAKTMNYTDGDIRDWILSAVAINPLGTANKGGFSGTMIKNWIF